MILREKDVPSSSHTTFNPISFIHQATRTTWYPDKTPAPASPLLSLNPSQAIKLLWLLWEVAEEQHSAWRVGQAFYGEILKTRYVYSGNGVC